MIKELQNEIMTSGDDIDMQTEEFENLEQRVEAVSLELQSKLRFISLLTCWRVKTT